MPGSKLSAKMKDVDDALDEVVKPASEFLKYRIQLGTLIEKVIPQAAAKGEANGASLASWEATAQALHSSLDNRRKSTLHYVGELRDRIDVLALHVKKYDPMITKNPKLLDDDRIKARETKKKNALALIEKARKQALDIEKMVTTT